jgi:2-hydroxy-6-oxonona-2,4-dienedioate hydrolase
MTHGNDRRTRYGVPSCFPVPALWARVPPLVPGVVRVHRAAATATPRLRCASVGVETKFRATEARLAAANGLDVQERWVDIASPPKRVRVLESGAGDPVLFINGISAPGIGMAALAGRLPGHRLLLVDLPGHGLSPPYLWQGAPVREQAVNIIAGLLDGLGIDQVTLVGNALGGLFSLWFALDRPSRVARVVLVGQPAGAIAGARVDLTMGVLTVPVLGRVVTGMARLPLPRFLGRMGLRNAVGADGALSLSDDIVDLHLLSGRLPGQFASYRSLLRRLLVGRTPRPENILSDAELASFTVPLLFVWPEDDRFLTPAAGKPSVDKIPTARFVRTPGGLFAWYDDPDRCAALVAEGLQPVPKPDSGGSEPLGT